MKNLKHASANIGIKNAVHQVIIKKIIIGAAMLLFFVTVNGQTWNTTAASTDWFTPGNWSSNLVPTSATDVIIPVGATNYPVISSGTANAKTITFSTGSGNQPSLTVSGGTLTDAGAFTVNAGSVTLSGGTVSIKDFTVASGLTVTQSGGNLFKISHDWKNSGTFTSSAGTVEYTGTAGAAADYSLGTNQFNNVIVDATFDPLFGNVACTISISGNLTNNNTTLADPVANTTWSFNGTGTQTISTAAGTTHILMTTLNVNKPSGTINLGSAIKFGSLTMNSGNFSTTASNYAITATGSFTLNSGTLSLNNSTVTITGNLDNEGADITGGTSAITVTGNYLSNYGTFSAASSTISVAGNWTNNNSSTFSVGTVTITGALKTIGGTAATTFSTLAVTGTDTLKTSNTCAAFTMPVNTVSSTLTIVTGATLTVNGDITINQPSVSSKTVSLNINTGAVIVNGNVNIGGTNTTTTRIAKIILTTGSLTITGNIVYNSATAVNVTAVISASLAATITLGGNITLTNNSGTLTPGTTSTLILNGTGSQTITKTAAIAFNHVTINKSSGTATLGAALTVANLNLLQGTLNSGGFALTISGSVLNNGGTLTGTPATTFTGAAKTISGTGTTDFGTITFNSGSSYTISNTNTCTGLTVPAPAASTTITQTTTGILTINGDVNLNQPTVTSKTTSWAINSGTATVSGNINIGGTNTTTTQISKITITTGTLNANGNIVFNSASATALTAVILMSGGAGTLNLKGALTLTNTTGTLTPGTTSTVNFNGTSAQSVTFGSAIVYNNINCNNAATVTLSAAVTATNVLGNIKVQTGVFSNGGFAIGMATSKTFQVVNGATFFIGGTTGMVTGTTITKTFGATSTVEYGGTNQTVSNETYGNLTLSSSSGAAVKTMPGTALVIAGNLTSSIATGTSVSFAALANISVSGNVTISASTTFDGSTFSHSVTGNWVNNGTYTVGTSTVTMAGASTSISGSGTLAFNNLTITGAGVTAGSVNITISGNLSTSGAGTFTHSAGGGFTMSGTSKTISGTGITFNDLTLSGTISTSSVLTITGNLSAGSGGSFTTSAGSVTMSGSSKTITATGAISFYNLTVSGSVTTATSFTITSALTVNGSLTASAGTATFTGTTLLTGTANLFNVTINGTSLQLAANSILGIAGSLTITSGTLDVTTSIPNTVHFNSSGAQTIAAATFHNLTFTGNTKTAGGAISVNGDLTINPSTTFAGSSYTHTLKGNWLNNGTFTAGTSTVQFTGPVDASITGATTFNIITLNKSASTNTLNLLNDVSVPTINMTQGVLSTGSSTLTITTTRTGSGIILGNIQRTHSFTTGVAYEFEGQNNTITFASVTGVTSILVKVTKGSISDFPFGGSINRLYDITIASGTYSATLRLHYEDAELNGNTESSMNLWNYSGSWMSAGKSGNSTTSNYVEQTGLTNIATRWTCSDNNNVLSWNGSVSSNWATAANWTVIQGTPASIPSSNDVVQIGFASYTNAPIISTAATAKSINFGSIVASTLSLNSGGSLTTQGNINGSWSSNATHTINTNAQTITVNGDIVLSDGTSGHAINLNISTGTVGLTGALTESGGANITFTGSGALNIGNNFTYTSGTFTKSTGTVTYNGSVSQVVAAVNYNNLTINKTGIATISSTCTISGDLNVSAGELDLNAATTITGNVTIASGATLASGNVTNTIGGNWSNSGTFTPSTGTVTLNGSGAQTVSASPFNNLTINKSTGTTLQGNLTITGNISILSGTLDLVTYTANRSSLGGSFSMSNGTGLYVGGSNNFPSSYSTYSLGSTSTVTYNGTVAQTVAGQTYGHLIFSNGGATAKTSGASATVAGDLTINSGATFSGSSYTLDLSGNWINSGTFTPATSTVNGNGTSKTITGNTTFNKLNIAGSYSVSGSDITMNGLLSIPTNGNFAGGSGTLTINGDLTNNGTFTSTGTTTFTGTSAQTIQYTNATSTNLNIVNFNGTVAPTLTSNTSPTYATVTINNTGGVTAGTGWTTTTSFTVSSGAIFNGSSATHTYNGSFTNNGTVSSSGTLSFVPTSTQTIKLAGTSFSSTGTLSFGGSGAITVTGTPNTLTNITISNTVGVTPSSNWTMGGTFLLNATGIFNAGTYTYAVGGDLQCAGTLNAGTSVFSMSSGAGTLSGSSGAIFYDLTISGTVTAIADFSVSHNFTNNGSYDGTSAVLIMTGSGASTIGGAASPYNLAQLSVRKSTGIAVTLGHNIAAVTSIDVRTGILDASTFSMTESVGNGNLSVSDNATLKIGGTNSLPAFTNYALDTLSTVEYNGTTQSVSASTAYGNLTISTSGTKTAAAALNVANGFTLSTGTFTGGAFSHSIGGNWSMASGTFTSTGTTIIFNGTAAQTITSTGSFNNLTINNSSADISLGGNITVSGTLTFTLGKIITGAYSLISSSGTVSGAAQGTGWVYGNMQKTFASGSNVAGTFQVGGSVYYSPATLTFASITGAGGAITVSNTDGAHPNLSGSTITADKNIPRYWTVTNTGSISFTTFTISLTWNTAENYSGLTTSLLKVGKYTSSVWSYPTVTGVPTTSNVQANGISTMGDFVAGEKCDIPATFSYTATPYCSNAGTASVTYSGGGSAGVFTSSPAGLSINGSTGAVNIGASTVGTYTVTNTTTGTGGCITAATSSITITTVPSATISYTSSPYCSSAGTATVTRTGTSGGVYTSTAGLTINSSTGAITLASSTAGTYTVTYTVAAAGGCSQYTTTASVTVTAAPAATISYAGSPYCTDGGTASVTFSGTTGGTYSSTAGLSINASTGAVTLATSTDGTYTVTYTVAAAGGCSQYTTTASITVNTSGKWSGAVSTAWSNASNWQCGVVPTSAVNVLIPAGLTNYPSLSSGTYAVNNLTISSGASLTVTASLQVGGTISNSGTFTASGGTVEMNGAGAQTIYATTYNNLILTGSGTTKTAGGALVVNGTLTVNSNVTMDMATYDLSGSITTITNSGSIKTQSASSTPLSSGKTWTGIVEYNKSGAQTIAAGNYNNLVASGGNTKTLGGAISVRDSLTIAASTTFALSSYDVTLISSATANARIPNTPSSAAITYGSGKFVVQRYVPGRRKYRMITSSVTTSTSSTLIAGQEALSIWGNWQNSADNVTANVGTLITGGTIGDGFDQGTTNPSLYDYDDVNKKFIAHSTANAKNTKYTPLKAGIAYYMFIYGDRTNTVFATNPHPTVLNARGTVLTGDQTYTTSSTIPLSSVTNRFTMLGNPFASAIDWATVSKTNIANTFWGWDPNLNSTGGYVTVSTTGTVTLVSPYTGSTGLNQYIQPGEGFFVKTTGGSPSMTIHESDKVGNFNSIAFRGVSNTNNTTVNNIPLIAVNLQYSSSGNMVLADGTLAAFDPSFSNSVGNEDGTKIVGNAEGIAVQNGTDLLSIEARQMPASTDTIFLNVSKLTKPQYTLQIFTNQMAGSGKQPYLVDNYLGTTQSISVTDTTIVPFSVLAGVPASSAANRFNIVFTDVAILPVHFTSITATQKNKDVDVNWNVAEESNVKKYKIERSNDGVSFAAIGEVNARGIAGNQSYQWLDVHPDAGKNFYRIRSVDADGKFMFSSIVWVNIDAPAATAAASIKVFPNPVKDQQINLQLIDVPKGQYTVQLINAAGQQLMTKSFDHPGGTSNQVFNFNNKLPGGIYYLKLIGNDKTYLQTIYVD